MQTPDLILSFLVGILSFLSPCVLPLVPVYLGYLSGPAAMAARTGSSVKGGTVAMSTANARWVVLAHAIMFLIGFTFVFGAVLGGMASFLAQFFFENRKLINNVMGVLLIVFGLHTVGIARIPFLDYTKRLDLRPSQNLGYLRSLLIGIGFAVGWTPCTSVQLGLIFNMAKDHPGEGMLFFFVYSLGFGLPFLLAALALGQISPALKRVTRRSYSFKIGNWKVIDEVNIISLISGSMLIIVGILVLTNALYLLSTLVPQFTLPIDAFAPPATA
jgi:cytochrome c-type biogenesis protein